MTGTKDFFDIIFSPLSLKRANVKAAVDLENLTC
jgi:hypothetical protein